MKTWIAKLIGAISRVQNAAARVPALLFLIAYVGMIPVFALYYELRASEFFHSTAKYESDILLDGAQVRSDLEQSVIDQFIERIGGPTSNQSEWLIDIREFRITQASFEEGRLRLKTYMRFSSDGGTMMAGPKIFAVDVRPNMVVGLPGSEDQYVLKFPQSDNDKAWPVPDSAVFQVPQNTIAPNGAIVVSPDLQNRITNLYNSFRGFPALSSGAYGRMLYFSAVTQTTLGYGDVVPISDRTRFAVALQSVLGIIMIGLFLNSLALARPAKEHD